MTTTANAIRPSVAAAAIPLVCPEQFLKATRGHTFSETGVFMMILSHLALTPGHKMSRAGIHAALRIRTSFAIDCVDNVLDVMFGEDEDGNFYRPRMFTAATAGSGSA